MGGDTDHVMTPESALKARQNTFFDHLIKQNERAELWRTVFNFALVSTGGLIAGLGKLTGVRDPGATWLTGAGLAMVVTGTILVGVFDFRRSRLTTQAKDALALAADFLSDKDALQSRLANVETLDKRRRFLLLAIQQMLEAIERMPHGTPTTTVIEAMLDAGSSDLEGAIGFEAGEKWTFSIFQRVSDPDGGNFEVMQRIVVSVNDRQRDKALNVRKRGTQTRTWKKKEGFTGVCWQRDDEVIEADLRIAEVARQYPVAKVRQKVGMKNAMSLSP